MFSVALSVERSQLSKPGGPPGRYPAHCSAEFGLSSPCTEVREATVRSGCLQTSFYMMLGRKPLGPDSAPKSLDAGLLNSL
jgi:hypothetical protein